MTLLSKIYRALTFDENFYRDLEHHRSNISQAVLVVLIVGICNGLGTLNTVSSSIIREIIFNLVGWFIWSFIIYLIGVKIFDFTSDLLELLMYLGFAFSPGIINILGLIPHLTYWVLIISLLWTILTFIYATKYALNCDFIKAFAVCVVSVIPYVLIRIILLII